MPTNSPVPGDRPLHSPAPIRATAETADGGAKSLDLPGDRAAAFLPADLLDSGEIVVLLVKPSPWYILLEPLRPLLTLAVLTFAAVTLNNARLDLSWLGLGEVGLSSGINSRDLLILGLGAIGMRLFWQLLEWLSRVYVLTDRRIIRLKGVITVHVFQTPLPRIQHTDLVFTLRERVFGLGSIVFSTAGTGGREAAWEMLANPLRVHQTLLDTIRRYGRNQPQ